MSELRKKRLITAKEAESYIPPLHEFVGNDKLRTFLQNQIQAQPPTGDANLLVEGEPGTAKTTILKSYLRLRLNNEGVFREAADRTLSGSVITEQTAQSLYDLRYWQTLVPGSIFTFVELNGATDSRALLELRVTEALYCKTDHALVLIDELGELYWRGHEELLRPMLTAPQITTYATAQNFHSKRRSDTRQEDEYRLRALLRRFTHHFTTTNPTMDDHVRYLCTRIREWDIGLDKPDTLRLLVERSSGVVGYSVRILAKAISENGRQLTNDFVTGADVDPYIN